MIQSELLGVGEYVAGGKPFDFAAAAGRFETLIDAFENRMQREKAFVLSGKTKLGALLDVARTVARRAERSVVTLTKRYMLPADINPYLNRLSDLLYILARYADQLGEQPKQEQKMAAAIEIPTKMGLQCAERICKAVLEKARAMDLRAVCAVCSAEGSLFALLRDDGALLASIVLPSRRQNGNIAANEHQTGVGTVGTKRPALWTTIRQCGGFDFAAGRSNTDAKRSHCRRRWRQRRAGMAGRRIIFIRERTL